MSRLGQRRAVQGCSERLALELDYRLKPRRCQVASEDWLQRLGAQQRREIPDWRK